MLLRLMPHLIVFALLLGLGASTGGATAREAVLLPASCELRDGRLVVQASRPTAHEIVSERERQVFSACRPGRSDQCRPIMVYRFEVACGTARVPWMDLAATLMATNGTRAWIEGERLHVKPPRPSRLGACESGDPTHGFMRTCDPWEVGDSGEQEWALPSGFAPVHEVGARFVAYTPPAAPQPSVAAGADDSGLQIPSEAEVAEADIGDFQPAHDEDLSLTGEVRDVEQPERASQVESGYEAFDSAERSEETPERPAALEPPTTSSFARDAAEAIAAAAPVQTDIVASANGITNATGVEPVTSGSDWSSLLDSVAELTKSWFSEQLVGALDPLTAMLNNWQVPPGRDAMAALMGLALLTFLVSGIGWYSVRAWRTRTPSFSAAAGGPQPTIHQFAAPPSSAKSADSGGSASSGASVWAATGTALLAPSDEKMCGELCRTAHTMLQQIEGRMDELQGVAPLRRVLQREMRNLEQFLTAVMTASPEEAEEWRRMRNRLQRIVRELHRLRDIVEGAYRSLSTGGFTSREPPRDKYEAYETLGVNPDVSPRTLKKLVDALRACWHPDLAKDETDRMNREERMKRINIAWDIITSKRQEA